MIEFEFKFKFTPAILILLLQFRLTKVAITANIKGTFLLIVLATEERNAVRFLKAKLKDLRMFYTCNFRSKIKSILIKCDFLTSFRKI